MNYSCLDDSTYEETRHPACTTIDSTYMWDRTDTFMIQKLDRSVVKEILFVRSTIPFLYGLSTKIKQRDWIDVFHYKSMNNFQIVMGKLCKFLFSDDYDEFEEEDELDRFENISSMPIRQRLLVDYGIIDILFSVIHYPINLGFIKLKTSIQDDS